VTLDPRRTGDAIAAAAADLARVWRAARAAARPGFFPGLLDGLVEPFLAAAGEALADGRHAALVWPSVAGVVRLQAGDLGATAAELEAEWDLAEQVLHDACKALDAGEGAREWVSRAIAIARTGTRTLARGDAPDAVLVVWVHSAPAVRRRASGPGRR
jgi:hypothetical protein